MTFIGSTRFGGFLAMKPPTPPYCTSRPGCSWHVTSNRCTKCSFTSTFCSDKRQHDIHTHTFCFLCQKKGKNYNFDLIWTQNWTEIRAKRSCLKRKLPYNYICLNLACSAVSLYRLFRWELLSFSGTEYFQKWPGCEQFHYYFFSIKQHLLTA